MAGSAEHPLLVLPPGIEEVKASLPPRGGGAPDPKKVRQIERLGPQFLELQKVLESRGALLSENPAATAPEHVLVFVTNGPRKELIETVASLPELEWLFQHEERVDQDDDFRLADDEHAEKELTACFYMVMFNQKALEQLLGFWSTYKTTKRMPNGLGAWGRVFKCLREIRRWGPEDRLREAGRLREWLAPIAPTQPVPVEIELWPRSEARSRASERFVTTLVEQAGGKVLDRARLPEIAYHALLAELPQNAVRVLLDSRDVALVQADEIFLLRSVPQCAAIVTGEDTADSAAPNTAPPAGDAVCALLDGLPMENHPVLAGRLRVDDPEGWSQTYPVNARRHGTAMASLIVHGDLHERGEPLPTPLHVQPILRAAGSSENAPANRLWVDVIHGAVRRMLAGHGDAPPTAPSVRVINLSVGDVGRPFLHELSPLARLLDWLAWKYQVLFIVSAGNHDVELPTEACASDETVIRHLFRGARQRRLLCPAESINSLAVGSLNQDGDGPGPPGGRARVIPTRTDVPAAYSAQGRGFRRAVKPDVLAPGGRLIFEPGAPGADAWRAARVQRQIGQLVAAPAPPAASRTTKMIGTSNAAALTSRSASFIHDALMEIRRGTNGEDLERVPVALLLKALLVHTADWHPDVEDLCGRAIGQDVDRNLLRDHLSGFLGYGSLRPARALGCAQSRATAVGGGHVHAEHRVAHRFPIPPCLQARRDWRRLTMTLAWFTPINTGDRRYRVARLRLETPRNAPPLDVVGRQVHGNATIRGTVQHVVLEREDSVMLVGESDAVEFAVTCAADAGQLDEPIPYALVVSLETAEETALPIYRQVAERLAVRPVVPVGVRAPR